MTEQDLQQYLIKHYPKEDEVCEWKEFKNLKNDFNGHEKDDVISYVSALANDFDETGGGYIVVGVKEVNGRPVRPVIGIDPNQIEPIEKDMVGFNNLMQPYYQPRLYIEETDGKTILVIKVSAGERRPYKVPDQIPPSRRRTTTTSDITVAALCPRVNMSAN